jgi:SAM-dependent methyltransferase
MQSSDATICDFHNVEAELTSGELITFSFGRNWQKYLRRLDYTRVAQARQSLIESLRSSDLSGLTFIDAGCGSGVFSLCALALGATHVTSIDIDPGSIECALRLRERDTGRGTWEIRKGSLLDSEFVSEIEPADIVYSWGVLHHTGAMWDAIANTMRLVRPGGMLCLALYREPGRVTAHMALKRCYNALPAAFRPVLCGLYYSALAARQSWTARTTPWAYVSEYGRHSRGMSLWRDVEDWLGGLPCEFATPAGVRAFAAERGFEVRNIMIAPPGANNEYLLARRALA